MIKQKECVFVPSFNTKSSIPADTAFFQKVPQNMHHYCDQLTSTKTWLNFSESGTSQTRLNRDVAALLWLRENMRLNRLNCPATKNPPCTEPLNVQIRRCVWIIMFSDYQKVNSERSQVRCKYFSRGDICCQVWSFKAQG